MNQAAYRALPSIIIYVMEESERASATKNYNDDKNHHENEVWNGTVRVRRYWMHVGDEIEMTKLGRSQNIFNWIATDKGETKINGGLLVS